MADKDKPLTELAAAERDVNPPVPAQEPPEAISMEPGAVPDGHVASEPEIDAAARMRAFEDEHIGPDAVRIDGQVERGVGSQYSRMHPSRHAQYEAIERLVASEQKLAAAHAALIQADVEHDEAIAAADRAESDADAVTAE